MSEILAVEFHGGWSQIISESAVRYSNHRNMFRKSNYHGLKRDIAHWGESQRKWGLHGWKAGRVAGEGRLIWKGNTELSVTFVKERAGLLWSSHCCSGVQQLRPSLKTGFCTTPSHAVARILALIARSGRQWEHFKTETGKSYKALFLSVMC